MVGIFFVEILVVIFSCIKRNRIEDFCDDGFLESAAFIKLAFCLFSQFALFFIVDKNSRTVGRTPVLELPFIVGWIDLLPENLKQLFIGKGLGLESDFNNF